jgi:hypothetical protein
MKKPFNRIALCLWIAAAVVAIMNSGAIYFAMEALNNMPGQTGGAPLVLRSFLTAATGTVTPVATLIGFATLIEIMDQIRWNARRE